MKAIYDAEPNSWESLPILEKFLPQVLPANWVDFTPESFGPYAKALISMSGLRVVISVEHKPGEDRWLHVSVSRENRLPSWEDLKDVKDLFIGREKTAIQILPKSSEYVNIHQFVLHLWHNLDTENFIPDFRKMGMI